MGRVETAPFQIDADVVRTQATLQELFMGFESYDSSYHPTFEAVISERPRGEYLTTPVRGLVVIYDLPSQTPHETESLVVTWHGLERMIVFWDSIKNRKFPDFRTRSSASPSDYKHYGSRAINTLETELQKAKSESWKPSTSKVFS